MRAKSVHGTNCELPRAPKAHLEALIESTRDLIWSVDLEYRLVTFNRAFAEAFLERWGVTVQVGMGLENCPEEANFWRSAFSRTLAEGSVRAPFETKDGRNFEVTLHPINHAGHVVGIWVFAKDVTECKLVESLLRASEARFRALVEKAPSPVGISREGITLYINDRFARMFGLADTRQAIGLPIGGRPGDLPSRSP